MKFGRFGGSFIPETLVGPVEELTLAFEKLKSDSLFQEELARILKDFVGRPTPLTYAKNLTEKLGGARIYLKREDLAHTGAHKINNTIGQILLAQKMGKRRIVAETGAGQHGVATATAAALFGMECVIYMGAVDVQRQSANVQRMQLLGAKVIPVEHGTAALTGTLKDAISEAMRDWITEIRTTYYLLGSALGPHPYPEMVRDFQKVIGIEAKEQILKAEGCLPNELVACVGGGSNAIGLFHAFLNEPLVQMTGVEAGGKGIQTEKHAARFAQGRPGVFHGSYTYLMQDENGQILNTESISAGLDYPGVGPEHCALYETGRVNYTSATDEEALAAFHILAREEGIIPALESAHAIAYVLKRAPKRSQQDVMVVNLSGRGDKDLNTVGEIQAEGHGIEERGRAEGRLDHDA